jgi:hypothetical protein
MDQLECSLSPLGWGEQLCVFPPVQLIGAALASVHLQCRASASPRRSSAQSRARDDMGVWASWARHIVLIVPLGSPAEVLEILTRGRRLFAVSFGLS